MRLVDADALGVGRCDPDVILDRAYAAGWNGIINIINAAPTIDPIRAAGGCRCGECKKYMTPKCLLCSFDVDGSCTGGPESDFYCGDGDSEPREAQDDG